MKITTKEVRDMTAIIDDIIDDYKEQTKKDKRDWRTYEQRLAERIIIDEAINSLHILKFETRGRKRKLSLKQKVIILLLKQLFFKSNREMSIMMALFSLLTEVDISYKTVERLYSDEEVIMVLNNIQMIILRGFRKISC
jgi:hypothetical protein